MDFHFMKRKELQALCKEHRIPANLKNFEMANKLTSLLKGEDKLLGENGCEILSYVENKCVKKVRFSPEIQTFEFQKSEVKYVTRSRSRKLVEKDAAAKKKKEGKGGIKNGALVMTRKSLRRKAVVDEGKSKNEDMKKGLKKKGRERNLRQGKGKDKERDNIAERDVEFMEVVVEKVVRRSKRNVTKLEDYKLISHGTVAAAEEKEKSPVMLGLRRSRRNVSSCNEPLISLDDLVEDVNYERKRKRQRGNLVKEQETVLVDSISIELPPAPLSPNVKSSERAVPESVVGKFAQKANSESKKQMVEVAECAIARDSENNSFIDNLKGQKWRSGSNSGRKSPPKSEDTSNSMELDNEVDQSESTDSKGIQVWVELTIDMETMSRPASLDHLVEDERIFSVKSQECTENQGDGSSTLNSGSGLDQKDLSQTMQTNKAEIDDVSGDRNNDQGEQICTMSSKSDESFKENYDSTDKFCESSSLEVSRSVTRTLGDENDNGGENSEQSADLEMKHLGIPSTDDKVIETSCSRIETTENVLDNSESNESYENQLDKDGDGDLIASCIQEAENLDNNFGELASSEVDVMLKQREQSPALNMCGSEGENVAEEAIVHDQLDLKNCDELDQSVEDRHFDKPEDEDSLGFQKNDVLLERREYSPSMDRDFCEADSVAEVDRNHGQGELKSDELSKSVEGRPSEEQCNSPDKCQMPTPSSRILEDGSANADKDFNKSGEEMFDENGTKEDSYDGITEKISDFASSKQLSEANFNINNFQEEFSCKDQEDNGKENRKNLTSIFSQVQLSMPEIHGEDKIVNIADDVSSSLLYKHHEILKESDVADTINEYIESESTMNQSSSLRIDDTGDTLNISMFTKVCRKSELSDERDQEKGAADLEETALRSPKVSDSKPTTTTTQRKNPDEMRTILIHGTPRKLQIAADMKENLSSFKKMEKIGSLTTVKPTTKRTALKDVFIRKK